MGIYDRDYVRQGPRRSRFPFGPQSVTIWLIAINVAVFLLDRILIIQTETPEGPARYQLISTWCYFSVTTAVQHLQIWRFITFQFLHANFDHIVFNMLALYFFGPLVENYLGSRRFVPFYLLCGIGGALFYMVLLALHFRIGTPDVPLVGASAGIFGILIAAAMIAPNATVLFMMIFPMPLRTLAWLFIAFAVYQVLFAGHNAGGEAAHLGGAVVGWLLMQKPDLLDYLSFSSRRRFSYR
jgi:membrane associated rhomboid family serine protease